ncbi:MAG TPA: cytochrome c [Caulifigura sp.]|nr:cytochrome c [Caulifigura sp.]
MLLASSCAVFAADPPAVLSPDTGPARINAALLPNAWQVTRNVISGGLPEGDDAFEELAKLGVKTVISVDGMTPDVATARQHGLRYVHLPHGYDGISEPRGRELAKAVRDLPGPIYIHCHHGKHRSPAAAAVACVEAGLISEEAGQSLLKLAGTNPDYRGLYESVRKAHRLTPDELDRVQVEFRESSPIPPLAEAMVELEHAFDRVKQHAGGQWKKRDDSRAAALLLLEQYKEMRRLDVVTHRTSDFQKLVADGETAAEELQAAMSSETPDAAAAESALKKLSTGCAACHVKYRDNARH